MIYSRESGKQHRQGRGGVLFYIGVGLNLGKGIRSQKTYIVLYGQVTAGTGATVGAKEIKYKLKILKKSNSLMPFPLFHSQVEARLSYQKSLIQRHRTPPEDLGGVFLLMQTMWEQGRQGLALTQPLLRDYLSYGQKA